MSVSLDPDVLILDARGIVIGGAARTDGPWQPGDILPLQSRILQGPMQPQGISTPAAAMLVGHAKLPDDLPPWTVVVAEPLANAFAPARRMVTLLATVLGGRCSPL